MISLIKFIKTRLLTGVFRHFCSVASVSIRVCEFINWQNFNIAVVPAKAGIQSLVKPISYDVLGSGLRRNDECFGSGHITKMLVRHPSALIGGVKNKPQQYLRAFFFSIAASAVAPTFAQLPTPVQPLPSPELALRLKKLESELRCLVCQNQTLADSPAGLAGDLRREVRSLVESGKTDAEIKDFLQVRYGDFVLYKPPVDPKTWVLWFGPFVLLGGGAAIAVWVGRRRRQLATTQSTVSPANEAKTKRAKDLLDEDEPK